jgi:hypothetical protein
MTLVAKVSLPLQQRLQAKVDSHDCPSCRYTIARYYSTPEHMTRLFTKLTNQVRALTDLTALTNQVRALI